MKRFLFVLAFVVLFPLITPAYTVVLKDGRRIEVRERYRLVNDIAIFSLQDGTRYSISVEKINVAATETANGLEEGSFFRNVTSPPKISDKKDNQPESQPAEDDSPFVASSRPTSKKLTNSDFDKYRVRREEMSRAAAQRAAGKAAAQMGAKSTNESEPAQPVVQPTPEETREATALATRRDQEKRKEDYWRARARALLTQIRVEEEQIAVVQAQIDETRRFPQTPPSTVSIQNQPNYPYNYPGVRIGGVPIGIGIPGGGGGYPTTGGGSSVVIINNQDQNQQRGRTLQERLTDLQVQHQATLVQYDEMCEEARRDGALPGWLR